MRRKKLIISAIVMAFIAAELGLAAWVGSYGKVRNFRIVKKAILYRSGQPDEEGWEHLAALYRIKTVVDLRELQPRAKWSIEQDEAARRFGFRVVHIPLVTKDAPTDQQWQQFLDVVKDPLCWPVLVHCEIGTSRTGMMVAGYRIAVEGADVESAQAEAEGYYFNSSEHPEYVAFWKRLAASRPATAATCPAAEGGP